MSRFLKPLSESVIKGGGGGGGVGGHPVFFVKLDFEIAVDQQTKAHNRTLEVIPDSGCPPDSHALICQFLAQFCQITLTCSKQCFEVLYL